MMTNAQLRVLTDALKCGKVVEEDISYYVVFWRMLKEWN